MDVGDGRNVAGHVRHTDTQEEACRRYGQENGKCRSEGDREVPWGNRLQGYASIFLKAWQKELDEGRDNQGSRQHPIRVGAVMGHIFERISIPLGRDG